MRRSKGTPSAEGRSAVAAAQHQGDERHRVRQGEEHLVRDPVFVPCRRSCTASHRRNSSVSRGAGQRPPTGEDDERQGDPAASRGDVLDEQPERPAHQHGAAQRGQRGPTDRGQEAGAGDVVAERVGGHGRLADCGDHQTGLPSMRIRAINPGEHDEGQHDERRHADALRSTGGPDRWRTSAGRCSSSPPRRGW